MSSEVQLSVLPRLLEAATESLHSLWLSKPKSFYYILGYDPESDEVDTQQVERFFNQSLDNQFDWMHGLNTLGTGTYGRCMQTVLNRCLNGQHDDCLSAK